MASNRKPAVARKSTQSAIKSLHRKSTSRLSLKEFVKTLTGDDANKASDWLFNKRANFSKPPLGVGSTRKKKGGGGKK